MQRRNFFQSFGVIAAGVAGARGAQPRPGRATLAEDYVTVYESPDPKKYIAYSPGLALLPSGRLIATMDRGVVIDGKKTEQRGGIPADRARWLGRIYTSGDGGNSWLHVTDMPMRHARPFAAGGAVYVLGHSDDLVIMRSRDQGSSWSPPCC